MMSNLRKTVFLSLLVSIGVAIGYIETLIPMPIAAPGARLGLSNIVILTTLSVFGYREGLTVAVLKSLLLMLVMGNVTSFFYSVTGGIFSCLAMILALKVIYPRISYIGVSEIGSAFHNLGQVTVAGFMVGNWRIITYLPVLLLLGIFTGYFVGLSSNFVVKTLKAHTFSFKE